MDDIIKTIRISSAGMRVQGTRLRVISQNIANADTPGYSVLACGIGSLTGALGGDREAGEAGNQEVLVHTKRVGVPDIITANRDDVARRIDEGFLGLLMRGSEADDAIRLGRVVAGS